MITQLKPSDIYFSQDSISCRFSTTGKLIGETLDDLYEDRLSVSDIKRISVALVNGQWFSWDNRRLWVFRQLEKLGKCRYITANVSKTIDAARLTTKCGGKEVNVRGQPGGYCYGKLVNNRHSVRVQQPTRSSTNWHYTNDDEARKVENILYSRNDTPSVRHESKPRRPFKPDAVPEPTMGESLWSAVKIGLGLAAMYLMWKSK
ncbi:uncharacterized protein LOC132726595 [Ruditapes philippinarum]|uniref:uncharacterized protein LOC132726595 n=1 Tax=Ruditapes philippinarum TaxID=129788 RepID=UPI00295C024A|nr:uncharacterized protein LOC132726595 [Ruditapes philippinarum]